MIGKKCGFVLLVFGILSIVLGVVIKFMITAKIDSELKAKLPLVNGSETWETWKNPGKLGVYMQFRFFSIKNHVDAKDHEGTPLEWGGRPVVEEKGPYVYRETRERTILGFNEDETELRFSEKTKFEFDASKSDGTENDMIHSINLPLMTVYNALGGMGPMGPTAKMMFNGAAKRFSWTVVESKTVKDWLWGVDSKILKFILEDPYLPNLLPPEMKAKIPSKKFGFMQDNTGSSTYDLGTGYKDLSDIGQIKKYNNMTKLDYWGSDYANTIKGTDGSVFHPYIGSKETLYMFTTDLCRSIYATNTGKQMVKGIETYLFSPPPDVFADPKDNPDNEGFCVPKPCLGSGLLRVSNCHHDAPLVITQPHLCDAAQKIQETVKGLNPDPQKHNTQLYIEPNLGAMIEAHKRLQFNALLLPEENMDLTANLTKNQIVPLFWVEEGFTADEEYVEMLQPKVDEMTFYLSIGEGVFYATICFGITLVIIAFFAFAFHKKTDQLHLAPPVRMTSVAKNSESGGYKNDGYQKNIYQEIKN